MTQCKIYEVLKINDIKKTVLIISFYVSLHFVMWACRVKNGEIQKEEVIDFDINLYSVV